MPHYFEKRDLYLCILVLIYSYSMIGHPLHGHSDGDNQLMSRSGASRSSGVKRFMTGVDQRVTYRGHPIKHETTLCCFNVGLSLAMMDLALLLLNCLFLVFIHLKLELLRQIAASNDEKHVVDSELNDPI